MLEKRIDTDTLWRRLLRTTSIGRFFSGYNTEINRLPAFGEYIRNLCEEKGVTAESIIKKADIERTYGHKFFNGTRLPSRDRVLQLSFGFGMAPEESQRLLTIARKSLLHPKVERDAVVIYALNNALSITDAQSMLSDLGLPGLGKERGNE